MGKVGGTVRAGESIRSASSASTGALDLVIANVLVLDPVIGIVKGDLGVRAGKIVGIGKAGNPDAQRGVDDDLVVGPHTSVIPGEGMIVTPGTVEAHAHLLAPDQLDHGLAAGTTTFVAMEWGNLLDIAVSGPTAVATLVRALEAYPVNVGLLARGSAHDPDTIVEGVSWGCLGVKVHEDLGASPTALDAALTAADRHDFAVCVHTDSMNESGYFEDTVTAVGGRSVHMFHTEGAGGGHVPDIIRVNGLPNVIPSSTNPTNPFTLGGLEESLPMTMLVHGLRPSIREDVLFAESRGRATTMAAEDLLHDLGAISIFAADTQGMGRVAENVACCWRLASVMKDRIGRLPEERTARADNERILRYLAKYTINPAIAFGIAAHVGSLEPGKHADAVLWSPAHFGVRPSMVLKSGVPAWSTMGDPSGSCTSTEPTRMRRQFGAVGATPATLGSLFVSNVAIERGYVTSLGVRRHIEPIAPVRSLGKRDMVRNDALPDLAVDPLTFEVAADGRPLTCEPAREVPLSWRYLLR